MLQSLRRADDEASGHTLTLLTLAELAWITVRVAAGQPV
jgi:hypothetical protein